MSSTPVTPEAIRRELRRLGFQVVDETGRAGDTWFNEALPDAPAVLVPREDDRGVLGFDDTIRSALQRLAWITGDAEPAIRRRLVGSIDRIELRIVHQLTARHSLNALAAPKVMQGFIDLIKNGARTQFNGARADHRGSGGPDYDAALAGIEVLAPAPGSFKLIAVAADPLQLAMTPDSSPGKARDALAATLRPLDALSRERRQASELSDLEVESLVDSGVSKLLLAAVANLAVSERSGLELAFDGSWDETIGHPDAPNTGVVLEDVHVSLARDLRPRLSRYEPEPHYRLVGWVETARADTLEVHGQPTGTVVVRQRASGRASDVLVELDRQVFPQVQPGVSRLSAIGTLERIGGRWHLTKPRNVQLY